MVSKFILDATSIVLRPSNCTKIVVGWGFAPDPTGGAYSAPPDPIAGLGVGTRRRGRGREQKGRGGVGGIGTTQPGTGREGKGIEGRMGWEAREGEGKEGEGGRGNKHTRFKT